jgi:hypothetical protein
MLFYSQVHGEVTDPDVDVFDREKVFIEAVLQPLVQRLPQLKVVMEHITTIDAVRFVESCKEGVFNLFHYQVFALRILFVLFHFYMHALYLSLTFRICSCNRYPTASSSQ